MAIILGWTSYQRLGGFTNQEELNRTGLTHFNGRVYDPRLGRFVSADPVYDDGSGSQAYNRYSYVMNNPMMYTDPSGYENKPKKKQQDGGGGLLGWLGSLFGGSSDAPPGPKRPPPPPRDPNQKLPTAENMVVRRTRRELPSPSLASIPSQPPRGIGTPNAVGGDGGAEAPQTKPTNPCPTGDAAGSNSGGAASSNGSDSSGGNVNSSGPSYVHRYIDFVSDNAINVGPYVAALAGGLWPKSLAPAGNFRPPLLGSSNPLTSVPRAFGVPGAGSAAARTGAAGIGLATAFVGAYDITIELEGFLYAIPSQESSCTAQGD